MLETLMLARLPLALVGFLVLPGAAGAQDGQTRQARKKPVKAAGEYEVKFEPVANNCTDVQMNLTRGKIMLRETPNVELSIPIMPVMYGRPLGRDAKFTVKADQGGTGIQGVQGKFRAAGRVDGEIIQFVVIAEYFQGKKPLCTKSWNASGVRADKLD